MSEFFTKWLKRVALSMAAGALVMGTGFTGSALSETRMLSASEQLNLSASESVAAIREGRLSAETYTRTLIARAEKYAALNTLIYLNKDGAISAARSVDQLRASGAALPPLAGLPIVVKDNINTLDMPTTGGTPALRDSRPSNNAPVLQKLLDAGAIVLGKANMHELAFGGSSTNLAPFAGPVHNPYNVFRVPGGSSGGTAAAVAAGIVQVGLGTDTGGSVREPASLCGVVGFRPSVGNGGTERRYDAAGVLPISPSRDTIGPIGRTMEDVALLDAVITGTKIAKAVPLKGLRIGIPASFSHGSDRDVALVLDRAKEKIAQAGVVLVDVDEPEIIELTHEVGFPIALHEAGQAIAGYLANTAAGKVSLADVVESVASPDVKPILQAVLKGTAQSDYDRALHTYRPKLQALYADYFNKHQLDAMLFPTMLVTAPPIDIGRGSPTVSINGGPLMDFFGIAVRNTDPGSSAGIPGITLPAGLGSDGLPVGLGLDGPLGSDTRLLGIGMAIQSVLGVLPVPEIRIP